MFIFGQIKTDVSAKLPQGIKAIYYHIRQKKMTSC